MFDVCQQITEKNGEIIGMGNKSIPTFDRYFWLFGKH